LTDPNIAAANESEKRSLAPLTYGLGLLTGSGITWLSGVHPAWLPVLNVIVIAIDLSYYGFMGWLFYPDFRMQFKVRRKQLTGTLGFRWQRTIHP